VTEKNKQMRDKVGQVYASKAVFFFFLLFLLLFPFFFLSFFPSFLLTVFPVALLSFSHDCAPAPGLAYSRQRQAIDRRIRIDPGCSKLCCLGLIWQSFDVILSLHPPPLSHSLSLSLSLCCCKGYNREWRVTCFAVVPKICCCCGRVGRKGSFAIARGCVCI